MIKFLKSLFVKTEVNPAVDLTPRGEIARKVSELFTITLIHNGGDCFEILTVGNLSKKGDGRFRYGEGRARNYFDSLCSLYGAK